MPSVLFIPSIVVMVHNGPYSEESQLPFNSTRTISHWWSSHRAQRRAKHRKRKHQILPSKVLSCPPFEDITDMPALEHQSDTSEQYNAGLNYLVAK